MFKIKELDIDVVMIRACAAERRSINVHVGDLCNYCCSRGHCQPISHSTVVLCI